MKNSPWINYYNQPDMHGYQELNENTAAEYIRRWSKVSGYFRSDEDLSVEDIGDGNLNQVFRIGAKNNTVIVKQALPYVRRVGKDWPLTPLRAQVEMEVLQIHGRAAPRAVPEVYHCDPEMYLMVMEDLSPAVILRKTLIEGKAIRGLGGNTGRYLGTVMVNTSDFTQPLPERKRNIGIFINPDLSKITEDLVLTNPYLKNGWGNRPEAMEYPEVIALQQDKELLTRIAVLRDRFNNYPQALLHGDFHSGSVMVGDGICKAIDLEFATYGPIGYDLGNIIGSLLINWVAQQGLAMQRLPDELVSYRSYLIGEITDLWTSFAAEIEKAWSKSDQVKWPEGYREKYIEDIWADTMGYAGTEMIRRTIGLGYVADLATISDPQIRKKADQEIIVLAVNLIKNSRQRIGSKDEPLWQSYLPN